MGQVALVACMSWGLSRIAFSPWNWLRPDKLR
jgi:hypothetical protein